VESADIVLKTTHNFVATAKADLADHLIAESAVGAGCRQIMTFDRSAAKHAGMSLTSGA
jgi:predicted nucleic-acid-binding protein